MKTLNLLFTLNSLITLIIIIERLSPTTKILLQPFKYIGLHELNQTILFLSITIVLSFFMARLFTNNFQMLQKKAIMFLVLFFTIGVYLYGAGEGWHEVASFTLNKYCNINHLSGNLCGGLFINDYYAGNIIFFIGGMLMNVSLMLLSLKQPMKNFNNKDMTILFINSFVYAFTWFAYAAFDKVLIGIIFSVILMIISVGFYWRIKSTWRLYPYIIYSAFAYSLATIGTIIVRFH